MYFYYVEDNFEFEYVVLLDDVYYALKQIIGTDDLLEYCEQECFEDIFELAEWYRDDLKDYFYEEALEWYRENR